MPSESIGIKEILREGSRVMMILLFWGILAVLARNGVGNIGVAEPGNRFFEAGNDLALLFAITGLVCILIYAIARGIQLARR